MIQLKLAKRNFQPCLVVETRTLEVDVVRDVPITVRRRENIITGSILRFIIFHIFYNPRGRGGDSIFIIALLLLLLWRLV